MKHILKCSACNSYTLKNACQKCNQATVMPRPARFSPEDKYGSYRREAKKSLLQQRGWL